MSKLEVEVLLALKVGFSVKQTLRQNLLFRRLLGNNLLQAY